MNVRIAWLSTFLVTIFFVVFSLPFAGVFAVSSGWAEFYAALATAAVCGICVDLSTPSRPLLWTVVLSRICLGILSLCLPGMFIFATEPGEEPNGRIGSGPAVEWFVCGGFPLVAFVVTSFIVSWTSFYPFAAAGVALTLELVTAIFFPDPPSIQRHSSTE